ASSNKNSTIAGTDALLTPFRKLVFKWLNRRGQRRSYRWRSFRRMLDRFQIHHPSVGAGSSEVMRELSHCTDKHQARLACVNLLGGLTSQRVRERVGSHWQPMAALSSFAVSVSACPWA